MTKINTEYITLQQLLKMENLVSSGGEAKWACQEFDICVNGEKEHRRGKKLFAGDEVVVNGEHFVIESED